MKEFLSEWFGLEQDEFSPYLTYYEEDGAVEHLFKVSCGLDSMILGETQILGPSTYGVFTSTRIRLPQVLCSTISLNKL